MKPSSKALLSLLLVLTIFTAASPAQAQKISAWWNRSSKALWGQSLQKAFAAPQLRQISEVQSVLQTRKRPHFKQNAVSPGEAWDNHPVA